MPFIHEDFLLSNATARRLFHRYAEAQPILDYHCHLPPQEKYFARTADELYEGTKNLSRHFFGAAYDPNAMQKKVLATLQDSRCIRCHETLLVKPKTVGSRIAHENPEKLRCVECHKVMHGRQL